MLSVRVLSLPVLLKESDLSGRTAVVFDVLRATTTIAAAVAAGAEAIRVYGTLDLAKTAAQAFAGPNLLAGETNALRPTDFDLGNSPRDFSADRCRGKTILMATTNGTRALVAARTADVLLTGSLANAAATAAAVRRANLPVTLIGSGTQGEVSLEDLLGCGAVIDALGDGVSLDNDTAVIAKLLWQQSQEQLSAVFHQTFSSRNLRAAELLPDVDYCCVMNRSAIACRVWSEGGELVIRGWSND
ncbi:MAG: 2-phosphosulfolactate phosphatase [Tepidisphaeraceae bacterium]